MSLRLVRSEQFTWDFEKRTEWYAVQAGEEIVRKFKPAVDASLNRVAANPTIGKRRRFRHPLLKNLHSITVNEPFGRLLIFYRIDPDKILAARLMHGSRDLPRRLLDPNEF